MCKLFINNDIKNLMLTTRWQVNELIQTSRTYILKYRGKQDLIKTKEGKNRTEGKATRINSEMKAKHMKQTNPNLINTMDMNVLNSLLRDTLTLYLKNPATCHF